MAGCLAWSPGYTADDPVASAIPEFIVYDGEHRAWIRYHAGEDGELTLLDNPDAHRIAFPACDTPRPGDGRMAPLFTTPRG